ETASAKCWTPSAIPWRPLCHPAPVQALLLKEKFHRSELAASISIFRCAIVHSENRTGVQAPPRTSAARVCCSRRRNCSIRARSWRSAWRCRRKFSNTIFSTVRASGKRNRVETGLRPVLAGQSPATTQIRYLSYPWTTSLRGCYIAASSFAAVGITMSLVVKLEDDLGERSEWVLLHGVVPTGGHADFLLLSGIDPFGKTVFNHLQMEVFLQEWD